MCGRDRSLYDMYVYTDFLMLNFHSVNIMEFVGNHFVGIIVKALRLSSAFDVGMLFLLISLQD